MQETSQTLMRVSTNLVSSMYEFKEKLCEFQATTEPEYEFEEILEYAEDLDKTVYDLLLGASEILQLAHAHEHRQFRYHRYYVCVLDRQEEEGVC